MSFCSPSMCIGKKNFVHKLEMYGLFLILSRVSISQLSMVRLLAIYHQRIMLNRMISIS